MEEKNGRNEGRKEGTNEKKIEAEEGRKQKKQTNEGRKEDSAEE